ncbi:MAG: branched-chain amino acid transport system substrate-binding protein [Ilumatobacteraceae bacterium]|jgi:branched-chain amino acid transport system substrate-binding protein|nr:branched-chain amino acid transport system substrate-binding protein [Ilumatobacteraceae bacterium]
MEDQTWPEQPIYSRRRVLALGGAAAVAAMLAACGSDKKSSSTTAASGNTTAGPGTTAGSTATTAAPTGNTTAPGSSAPAAGSGNAAKFGGGGGDGTVKIGFTAPLTGALAGFGEANPFILGVINKLVANGIMLGDKSYKVEIVQKDVESNSDTAASRAGELITSGVDLMLAIATPEMINPVADQCEANGVPCLSTLAPWQPYFFGRNGDPAKGFDWTYHFFWGADQLVKVFGDMWQSVTTDKTVGLLCPNDPDGNALADAKTGFPAGVSALGYKLVDPGRFQTLSDDFSSVIGQMKDGGVEIVAGIPIPPDFATFWTQAKQQGFNPKLVTMAKAVLFSSAVEALGDIGDGLASEVWWTPNHPFTSSLTGETSKVVSDQYETSTGKQWTQFVGFVHALFEVCFDVLARAGSTDKQAIADAAAATQLNTLVGPIAYGKNGLPKNISPTSLVGGQWKKTSGGKFPFELLVVNNTQSPEIPTNGTLVPLA